MIYLSYSEGRIIERRGLGGSESKKERKKLIDSSSNFGLSPKMAVTVGLNQARVRSFIYVSHVHDRDSNTIAILCYFLNFGGI